MRIGTVISVPDEYTRFARIKDEDGVGYTVDPSHYPEDEEPDIDDEYAYKVEIWENDSGLVYWMEED